MVKKTITRGDISLLEVKAKLVIPETNIGDSIAVNGVCLTVIKKEKDCLSFEMMHETLKRSNLSDLGVSDVVNLERSLKVGDRLSGHFVLGHVDAKSVIRKKTFAGRNLCLNIAIPQGLNKYIAEKGSVAVDGISLTVADIRRGAFLVHITPHTFKNTTLRYKNAASFVNIEVDVLARYAKSGKYGSSGRFNY